MKFTISRDQLLKPLQQVCAIVPNKPQVEAISNILMSVTDDNKLLMTGTDLDVELTTIAELDDADKEIVGKKLLMPAKKFLDIAKGLAKDSVINVVFGDDKLTISAARSRFHLSVLDSNNYPDLTSWQAQVNFSLKEADVLLLLEATAFSMANGDARYYLNGMRLETRGNVVKAVSTDGHRLSLATLESESDIGDYSIIIPRKSVLDLIRLLNPSTDECHIAIGSGNIRVSLRDFTFNSKLIDGNFPDYTRIFPRNPERILEADVQSLKNAVVLAGTLSDDHSTNPVRFKLAQNLLKITVFNNQKEESEGVLDVMYQGEEMEVAFNIRYLVEVFNVLKCTRVRFNMVNENSSCLIEDCNESNAQYLLMPMRI